MNQTPTPQQKKALLRNAAGQLGMTPEALRSAMQSGAVMQQLPPEDARMLQQALADPKMAARVLASPEAQALMQQLFGGK